MYEELLKQYPESVRESVKKYNEQQNFWYSIRMVVKNQIPSEQYCADLPIELMSPGVIVRDKDGKVDPNGLVPIMNRVTLVIPPIAYCKNCKRSMAVATTVHLPVCCNESMSLL